MPRPPAETALLVAGRTGKGSLDVPEELRVQKIFRQGAAVDCQEWLFFAGTYCVNRACNNLFAGTGLSHHQHGDIR